MGWLSVRGIHMTSSRFLNQAAPANRVAFINDQITNGGNLAYTFKPFGGTDNNSSLGNQNQYGDFGGSVYDPLQEKLPNRVTHRSQIQASFTLCHYNADTKFSSFVRPAFSLFRSSRTPARLGNADYCRR